MFKYNCLNPIAKVGRRILLPALYYLLKICPTKIITILIVSNDAIFDKINKRSLSHTISTKHKIHALDKIKSVI